MVLKGLNEVMLLKGLKVRDGAEGVKNTRSVLPEIDAPVKC